MWHFLVIKKTNKRRRGRGRPLLVHWPEPRRFSTRGCCGSRSTTPCWRSSRRSEEEEEAVRAASQHYIITASTISTRRQHSCARAAVRLLIITETLFDTRRWDGRLRPREQQRISFTNAPGKTRFSLRFTDFSAVLHTATKTKRLPNKIRFFMLMS